MVWRSGQGQAPGCRLQAGHWAGHLNSQVHALSDSELGFTSVTLIRLKKNASLYSGDGSTVFVAGVLCSDPSSGLIYQIRSWGLPV